MRKQHTCEEINVHNLREPEHIITIKHYELGGWEIEKLEPYQDENSSIDEIHFCPFCGTNLEDKKNE